MGLTVDPLHSDREVVRRVCRDHAYAVRRSGCRLGHMGLLPIEDQVAVALALEDLNNARVVILVTVGIKCEGIATHFGQHYR